jgi:hypothetical protein
MCVFKYSLIYPDPTVRIYRAKSLCGRPEEGARAGDAMGTSAEEAEDLKPTQKI